MLLLMLVLSSLVLIRWLLLSLLFQVPWESNRSSLWLGGAGLLALLSIEDNALPTRTVLWTRLSHT